MAEYIDREKAIEIIESHMTRVAHAANVGTNAAQVYNMAKNHAIDYLRCMPAAAVVEVVRCKDCAKRLTRECALWYGTTANNGTTTDYFCAAGQLNENFYCAYGVKREA